MPMYTVLLRTTIFWGENNINIAVINPQKQKLIKKKAALALNHITRFVGKKAAAVNNTADVP